MENPGEMVRRAALNRPRSASGVPTYAPQTQEAAAPDRPTPPLPKASHANYSALMRSHDRVHTCHLEGQGRETRA